MVGIIHFIGAPPVIQLKGDIRVERPTKLHLACHSIRALMVLSDLRFKARFTLNRAA
jgi:hypothetical protein